jgi:hypothetical protein
MDEKAQQGKEARTGARMGHGPEGGARFDVSTGNWTGTLAEAEAGAGAGAPGIEPEPTICL